MSMLVLHKQHIRGTSRSKHPSSLLEILSPNTPTKLPSWQHQICRFHGFATDTDMEKNVSFHFCDTFATLVSKETNWTPTWGPSLEESALTNILNNLNYNKGNSAELASLTGRLIEGQWWVLQEIARYIYPRAKLSSFS